MNPKRRCSTSPLIHPGPIKKGQGLCPGINACLVIPRQNTVGSIRLWYMKLVLTAISLDNLKEYREYESLMKTSMTSKRA